MASGPQLWTLNGLSVECKIYRAKLAELLATLPPDFEEKGEKRWLLARVLKHLIEAEVGGAGKKLDRTQEDAKLKKVQADLKELDLQVRRGQLVEIEEVGSYLESLVMAFRQRVLAIPRRLAPVLEGKKVKQIEARARQELSKALEALAKLNPDDLVKRSRAKGKGTAPAQGYEDEART